MGFWGGARDHGAGFFGANGKDPYRAWKRVFLGKNPRLYPENGPPPKKVKLSTLEGRNEQHSETPKKKGVGAPTPRAASRVKRKA